MERRLSPRYAPRQDQGWLSWGAEPARRTVAAGIMDLSQGGAAVVVEEAPPPGATAWVFLGTPDPGGWVEATVVGHTRGRRGHVVRLAFCEPCPWDLFRVALYGPNRQPAVIADPKARASFADANWR